MELELIRSGNINWGNFDEGYCDIYFFHPVLFVFLYPNAP